MTTKNRNNNRRNGGTPLFQAVDASVRQGLAQVKTQAIENKRQQARDKAIAERRNKRQQEREAARAAISASKDIVNDISAAKRNIVTLAKSYNLPVPNIKRVNPEVIIAEAAAKQLSVVDVINQTADATCTNIRQNTLALQDDIATRKGNDFNLVAAALLSYLAQRVVRASAALDVASASAAVGKFYKSQPNAEVAAKAVADAEAALDAYYTVLLDGSANVVGEKASLNPNSLLRSYVKTQLAKVLKLKLDPQRDPLVYAAQVLAAKARKRTGSGTVTKAEPAAVNTTPYLTVPAEYATDERSSDAAVLCYINTGNWPTSKQQLAAYKGQLTKLEKQAKAA